MTKMILRMSNFIQSRNGILFAISLDSIVIALWALVAYNANIQDYLMQTVAISMFALAIISMTENIRKLLNPKKRGIQ